MKKIEGCGDLIWVDGFLKGSIAKNQFYESQVEGFVDKGVDVQGVYFEYVIVIGACGDHYQCHVMVLVVYCL